MRTSLLSRLASAALLLSLAIAPTAHADKATPPPLSEEGKALLRRYTDQLATLRKEVTAKLPTVDEAKAAAFLKARAELDAITPPEEGAAADDVKAYKESKEAAASKTLAAARAILADIDPFIATDELDVPLMQIAILSHGTPRGFAEFAQQGPEQEALLANLLSDADLMREVLRAGGANGGEYGEAMQVFGAIQKASTRASEKGTIFYRLALGTSLHQPWLPGSEKGGVYGLVFADNSGIDQVARYLHYEKAFLDGELDPAFKDMNTWQCRYITNDPYTDEELAWTREMIRNYRPDHIANPDYKWRYVRIVKSDVPYKSPDWRPDEGTSKVQQIVAGGGKCGPRAFFGRTAARAFGIPSRRSTQSGHAALNHWTPDGWVICFGAWWSMAWCGPWGGEDFLLESQARDEPAEFAKVQRTQWIADALGEEDVSLRQYGQGGGLWNALAFYKKRAIVEDAKAEALELAGGMKLGESDDLLGDEEGTQIQIPEADRTITTDDNGVITIPVAACRTPESTSKILFMESVDEGTQVHYARLGKRPELLTYSLSLPKAGTYNLTAHVVTVSRKQSMILRVNRRTFIDIDVPWTLGTWKETEPVAVELREGRNSLMFTSETPNRGITIKYFTLTPTSG